MNLALLLGVTSNSYVELGLLLQGYVWLKTSNVSCLAYHVLRNEYFAGNMNMPNSTPWPQQCTFVLYYTYADFHELAHCICGRCVCILYSPK